MALAYANIMGKTAVEVKKDSPGFIFNRLLVPYLNEAVKMHVNRTARGYGEGAERPEEYRGSDKGGSAA